MSDLRVRIAVDHECPTALRMICDGFVPAVEDKSGVWIATRGDQMVAAAWLQFLGHQVGGIWPPVSLGDAQAEDLLASALSRACEESSFRLVRSLVAPESQRKSELVRQVGLTKRTQLTSLYRSTIDDAPGWTGQPSEYLHRGLRFCHLQEVDHVKATELMQLTYRDSLDCPELTTVISADMILDGYLRHSEPKSRFWFRVATDSANSEEVGVLFVHDDDEDEQTELLYLGVIPEFRGHGHGAAILDFANLLTRHLGRRRMTLAVDVRNAPAMRIYRQAGFASYAMHDLYARIL